jgi:hypothetical protein
MDTIENQTCGGRRGQPWFDRHKQDESDALFALLKLIHFKGWCTEDEYAAALDLFARAGDITGDHPAGVEGFRREALAQGGSEEEARMHALSSTNALYYFRREGPVEQERPLLTGLARATRLVAVVRAGRHARRARVAGPAAPAVPELGICYDY